MVIYLFFCCHVNGYIPCYITLKSRAPLPPPQIPLHSDFQQIESKECLFTPCQAGKAPQHPWSVLLVRSVLLVSGSALVIIEYGHLLGLRPVRGLKLGHSTPSVFELL